VELYWDRSPDYWRRAADGSLSMYSRPLEVEAVVMVAEPGAAESSREKAN
jgi:catechol-2,3-dioxygenase